MIELLKRVLRLGPTVDYDQLVKQGAVILDVRTKAEYQTGHIHGSLNIPVDQLKNNLHRIPDKQTPIITCCASGMRSASAESILKLNGYKNVCNGGSWVALENKI